MIKTVCDKCGTVINTDYKINALCPKYSIKKYTYSLYKESLRSCEAVHLCLNCEKLFDKWLNEDVR